MSSSHALDDSIKTFRNKTTGRINNAKALLKALSECESCGYEFALKFFNLDLKNEDYSRANDSLKNKLRAFYDDDWKPYRTDLDPAVTREIESSLIQLNPQSPGAVSVAKPVPDHTGSPTHQDSPDQTLPSSDASTIALQKGKDDLDGRCNSLQKEKDDLDAKCKSLQEEKNDLDARCRSLQLEKESLESELNFLKIKINDPSPQDADDASRQEKERILAKYNELMQEKNNLASAFDTLKKEKDDLAVAYDALMQEKSNLAAAFDTLKKEKDDLTAAYDALMQEKNDLIAAYDALMQEKSDLASAFDTLKKEKDDLASVYDALKKEKDDLTASYDALKKEKDDLTASYVALKKGKDDLDAAYDTLKKEKDDLAAAYNTLMQEKDYLESVANALKQERDKLTDKNELLQKEKETLTSLLEEYQKTLPAELFPLFSETDDKVISKRLLSVFYSFLSVVSHVPIEDDGFLSRFNFFDNELYLALMADEGLLTKKRKMIQEYLNSTVLKEYHIDWNFIGSQFNKDLHMTNDSMGSSVLQVISARVSGPYSQRATVKTFIQES